MQKYRFYIIAGLIFVLGVVCVFGGYVWFLKKQERVLLGLANPTWPYEEYTSAQLEDMYPQYANVDVSTTQTPEQTHAKFIAALKKGDLDGAVQCCFREGDWTKTKIALENTKKQGLIANMLRDLQTIKPNFVGETLAEYSFSSIEDGGKFGHTISFVKSKSGIWLIESL